MKGTDQHLPQTSPQNSASSPKPGRRLLTRRNALLFGLGFAAAPAGAALLGCKVFSAPPYAGPVSDHFDGERFYNLDPLGRRGFRHFLRWRRERDPGPWPLVEDAEPGPPPPRRVGRGGLRATFVNHATVLIQADGLNLLTDPIWSERASPVAFAGPRRVRPPGIRFGDLPPIDAVLVSHNHYDHLDVPTLRRLAREHRPRIFAPLGNAAFLEAEGIAGATDMDWWDRAELAPGVGLSCVPARHWSGRGTCDRAATLWGGFVIDGPAGPIYFAGDTGDGRHFAMVRERFGRPRLAILPIGAYLPAWFMGPVHLSPAEALDVHRRLGSRVSMGMHYGTFELADDGRDRALDDLARARAAMGVGEDEFWTLDFGEGRDVPAL